MTLAIGTRRSGATLLLIDYNQKPKVFSRETVDYFHLYSAKMAMTAISKQTHGHGRTPAPTLSAFVQKPTSKKIMVRPLTALFYLKSFSQKLQNDLHSNFLNERHWYAIRSKVAPLRLVPIVSVIATYDSPALPDLDLSHGKRRLKMRFAD
jgi:hypothetical protein